MKVHNYMVEACHQSVMEIVKDLNGLDQHMVLMEVVRLLSETADRARSSEYMIEEDEYE